MCQWMHNYFTSSLVLLVNKHMHCTGKRKQLSGLDQFLGSTQNATRTSQVRSEIATQELLLAGENFISAVLSWTSHNKIPAHSDWVVQHMMCVVDKPCLLGQRCSWNPITSFSCSRSHLRLSHISTSIHHNPYRINLSGGLPANDHCQRQAICSL